MRKFILFTFATLAAGNSVAAEKHASLAHLDVPRSAEKALANPVLQKRDSRRHRLSGNVLPAAHGETIDGPMGSGDQPQTPNGQLTRRITLPAPRTLPGVPDTIASDRNTDLGILGATSPLSLQPIFHASVGSNVDHLVRVRNYGPTGKTVYVAVIQHSRPRLAFRTVRVFVPARSTRNVTLPVPVLPAPIADGYYRATITLMRTSDPALTDVFQDADADNNVFDVRIPVHPQRINPGGG
jgi:hypothetical protein